MSDYRYGPDKWVHWIGKKEWEDTSLYNSLTYFVFISIENRLKEPEKLRNQWNWWGVAEQLYAQKAGLA